MVTSNNGTGISTKVTQSQEVKNLTVDVVYQFVNGMHSRTFKFLYCSVQKCDGGLSTNIETSYNFL